MSLCFLNYLDKHGGFGEEDRQSMAESESKIHLMKYKKGFWKPLEINFDRIYLESSVI